MQYRQCEYFSVSFCIENEHCRGHLNLESLTFDQTLLYKRKILWKSENEINAQLGKVSMPQSCNKSHTYLDSSERRSWQTAPSRKFPPSSWAISPLFGLCEKAFSMCLCSSNAPSGLPLSGLTSRSRCINVSVQCLSSGSVPMWLIVSTDLLLWLVVSPTLAWFADVEDVAGLMIVLFLGVSETLALWGLAIVLEISEKELKNCSFNW